MALKARVFELQSARVDSALLGNRLSTPPDMSHDEDVFATDADIDALCHKSELLLRTMEKEDHLCTQMNAEARGEKVSNLKEWWRSHVAVVRTSSFSGASAMA